MKKTIYLHKIPIFLGDVDIKEVSVSRKIYSSEINYIYFVAYLYNHHKVKPFYIIFLKQALNVKSCDGKTKWMHILNENDDFLKEHTTIWDKVSTDIEKEFDSKPVYNKFFLKTKRKSDLDEVTGFYNK